MKNKCIWKKKLYSPVTTFREVHKYPWALCLPAVSLEKLPKSVRLTGNSWELTALLYIIKLTSASWAAFSRQMSLIRSRQSLLPSRRFLTLPSNCRYFGIPSSMPWILEYVYFRHIKYIHVRRHHLDGRRRKRLVKYIQVTNIGPYIKLWPMTDYRRERQSYESRAGGDEGGQGWDGRTV